MENTFKNEHRIVRQVGRGQLRRASLIIPRLQGLIKQTPRTRYASWQTASWLSIMREVAHSGVKNKSKTNTQKNTAIQRLEKKPLRQLAVPLTSNWFKKENKKLQEFHQSHTPNFTWRKTGLKWNGTFIRTSARTTEISADRAQHDWSKSGCSQTLGFQRPVNWGGLTGIRWPIFYFARWHFFSPKKLIP